MKLACLAKAGAFLLLALPLILMGCEGDEGPRGPAGPPGDDGTLFDFTYVGDKGEACNHCHNSTVDAVLLTAHSDAYDDLEGESAANPYCLQCHTTGWDRAVTYTGVWATENPDTNGYDDYFDVAGADAAARRASLEGVQCESCHGPMGPDFNDHRPIVKFATIDEHDPANITEDDIVSSCYPCHGTQFEGPSGDFATGYATSGHANPEFADDLVAFSDEFGGGSCSVCHTSEGFIRANDPAFATYEFGELVSFIGCVTCHDPHMGAESGGNEAQLRNLTAEPVQYTFPYDPDDPEVPEMDGYGPGQLCAQCHHARRNTTSVLGQIDNGNAHFGPHGSPQMDMFIGAGCYEIPGYTYDREAMHQGYEKGCVSCHMLRETTLHGEENVPHAFHNFRPSNQSSNTGPNCAGCHEDPPAGDDEFFDFGSGQTEVVALMDELSVLFGYADHEGFLAGLDEDNLTWERWQREAAYALIFVYNDGSMGVHNPVYAKDLLENAIAYYNDKK
ncbi:MAG TPA: multiheme c-type cytochrome [Candidatus Krumholzibacteria bacterium]|nr:multiheme c-type cytochrome [Candidatus Krumholzibacteria bacterium]HPD70173.1 multiheme c-type cytochrome [Candidatus Krumholzibacteria bacterium]HRY40127.1 multiheme c-type cytochrome [Candidatus Krumholzibacteria bacterium]